MPNILPVSDLRNSMKNNGWRIEHDEVTDLIC